MKIFLAVLACFCFAVLAMAVGVIVSNRRIKGSCGGLNAVRDENGEPVCQLCGKPVADDCDGPEARQSETATAR